MWWVGCGSDVGGCGSDVGWGGFYVGLRWVCCGSGVYLRLAWFGSVLLSFVGVLVICSLRKYEAYFLCL